MATNRSISSAKNRVTIQNNKWKTTIKKIEKTIDGHEYEIDKLLWDDFVGTMTLEETSDPDVSPEVLSLQNYIDYLEASIHELNTTLELSNNIMSLSTKQKAELLSKVLNKDTKK